MKAFKSYISEPTKGAFKSLLSLKAKGAFKSLRSKTNQNRDLNERR